LIKAECVKIDVPCVVLDVRGHVFTFEVGECGGKCV